MTISAKVIAASVNRNNVEIVTFELEYPRFIHSELMTHRVFSRNAASSRAIPVERMIGLIEENTAMPIHWGKNQPGMSAKEEHDAPVKLAHIFGELTYKEAWEGARESAVCYADAFHRAGYHKQIVNRLLEPYSHIKVVVTATEWDNFFELRNHPDAQPEIHELARVMKEAMDKANFYILKDNDWHMPYFHDGIWEEACYNENWMKSELYPSLQDALAISASCCAQVSYRRLDTGLDKAREIYKRLIESKPMHASPFEHAAKPMGRLNSVKILEGGEWPEGVTHFDRNGNYWSGNFRDFIQYRQLLK